MALMDNQWWNLWHPLQIYRLGEIVNCSDWPPVTSHMASTAASSAEGINVLWFSGGGTAGMRRTRPNKRWSHRKGSLVSSLPGTTWFIGKLSCKQHSLCVNTQLSRLNAFSISVYTQTLLFYCCMHGNLSSKVPQYWHLPDWSCACHPLLWLSQPVPNRTESDPTNRY